MENLDPKVAHQLSQAVCDFEQRRSGRRPKSVTVVLNENTLVIKLHGALSPAEKALATSPSGAVEVEEFHRLLFNNFADSLQQEIEKITEAELREVHMELGFEVGADIPIHGCEMRKQIRDGSHLSEVEKERENQMRTRANEKRQIVHEQRNVLGEKWSAISKARKEKRKEKSRAEEAEKAIQRSPAGKKSAETLKAKRAAARKKEQANYRKDSSQRRRENRGKKKANSNRVAGKVEE